MRSSFIAVYLAMLTMNGMSHPIDPLRRSGESTIIAFQLADSTRYVSVCESQEKSYIVYRFGSAKKVEMEYPASKTKAWSRFEYSYYLRGGGANNEGLDLNYLSFINGDWKYILYEEHQAADNRVSVGVRVINLKNNKRREFPGLAGTLHGSLIPLRENRQVQKGEVPEDF